jgi:hypothetical protein
MRTVCTILYRKCGIDTMKNKKMSDKKMSTDKYVVIVHEDGYAIKNTVQDKLLTLYRHEFDAKRDLQILLEKIR